MTDVERLLRTALVPVEPSGALGDRLEQHLAGLTEAAVDELADWELSAMRDPRNWVRPAAAIVVGGVAGGALVIVRARQQQRKRQSTGVKALQKSVRDLSSDVRGRLRRARRSRGAGERLRPPLPR